MNQAGLGLHLLAKLFLALLPLLEAVGGGHSAGTGLGKVAIERNRRQPRYQERRNDD